MSANELLDAARYRMLKQILDRGRAGEIMVNLQRLYVGGSQLPNVEIQVHQTSIGHTKIYAGETLDSLLDGQIDRQLHTRETT
jgi:hypothetical protein